MAAPSPASSKTPTAVPPGSPYPERTAPNSRPRRGDPASGTDVASRIPGGSPSARPPTGGRGVRFGSSGMHRPRCPAHQVGGLDFLERESDRVKRRDRRHLIDDLAHPLRPGEEAPEHRPLPETGLFPEQPREPDHRLERGAKLGLGVLQEARL